MKTVGCLDCRDVVPSHALTCHCLLPLRRPSEVKPISSRRRPSRGKFSKTTKRKTAFHICIIHHHAKTLSHRHTSERFQWRERLLPSDSAARSPSNHLLSQLRNQRQLFISINSNRDAASMWLFVCSSFFFPRPRLYPPSVTHRFKCVLQEGRDGGGGGGTEGASAE